MAPPHRPGPEPESLGQRALPGLVQVEPGAQAAIGERDDVRTPIPIDVHTEHVGTCPTSIDHLGHAERLHASGAAWRWGRAGCFGWWTCVDRRFT
jgi:hypothetical protein